MPELIPAEPGTPDWHAARRLGVTATDIVTILGLSHYDSPYSLFWRKLGQVPEVEDNDRFRLGRALEEYIWVRWLESREEWAGWADYRKPALFRHDARSWQLATPDRVYPEFTLELKSWADADRPAWQDGPPPAVRAQVLWQMDVMDVAAGHVGVVFLPSGEFRSYTIEHAVTHRPTEVYQFDDCCEICKDIVLMRIEGQEFMRRLRLELPPPDPDSSAATLAAVRARFARVPAKQAEIDPALWEWWVTVRDDVKRYEDLAREAEIQLREQAGEAAEYTVDGQVVARRVISDAQVKAHVRHQDYIRRIKQGDDDAHGD